MKHRVIFAGTIEISKNILATLIENDSIEVVGVICQPDKPTGRNKQILFNSVKQYCLENNLNVFQPNKVIEIYDELVNLNPDFLVTCAFGQFVPVKVLSIFKDCINVHASMLPKYRGGSPLQKAVADGLDKTGISIMRMVKAMDAGPVFIAKEFNIDFSDNIEQVFNKASIVGCDLIRENILNIFEQKINPIEQDESKVTFAYNLKNEEEKVDFSKSSIEVYNFIRSLTPKPAPFTFLNTIRIKIYSSEIIEDYSNIDKNHNNGQIIEVDKNGIVVKCGNDTYIRILEVQREGKTRQKASTYYKNQSIFKNNEIFK